MIPKKALVAVAAAGAIVVLLAGCSTLSTSEKTPEAVRATGASSPTPSPTPEAVKPPELAGEWKQNNSASADGWMTATITANTITANFVTNGGDTTSLFWAGSFTPPSDDSSPYVWTSSRDEAATESALLASTDATKDFSYEDSEISFPVTIAGSTATVRMSRE
ncbi:hypothetical protein BJK06_02605 [Curtobacterium sp. BH-2-1-1]|uniref:hypothetical protein n=1 Tax=Curtobacterium sp. BH-2-1-1 TaxID=1905847 RepID=UPI00089DE340|nr:hypothetical protein [Curtobacterium sp. BH-2-1-1]AOX64813.1 hypothetical protein BJK06_02605 [Curtobacterium sp. BH-2-1-1]